MSKNENEKTLGLVQLSIMSVIREFPEKSYGTAIAKTVSEKTKREISDAQVFMTLSRLEKQRLLEKDEASADLAKKGPGRPRKKYKLTEAGLAALNNMGIYGFISETAQRITNASKGTVSKMNKMKMNEYEMIVKAIADGEKDDEKLDQMFWAAENGHDIPLRYYDEETWIACANQGDPSATAISNLGHAIQHIESGDWNADFMMHKRPDGKVVAEVSIGYHCVNFKDQTWIEGPTSLMSRMLVSSFCKIRPAMNEHYQKILPYIGESSSVPKISEWPIELCEDGQHRAINREHGLVMYVIAGTREKVEENARLHRWNDLIMMKAAERFSELVEKGVIAPTPDNAPAP